MEVEIVTTADLELFRQQLLRDIKEILATQKPKKWLKTQEVMQMLDISEVTLQTLRNKGIIPFRKLGGICYYNIDEIDEVLQNLKP